MSAIVVRWWEWLVVAAIMAVIVAILWPTIDAFRAQPTARRELIAFTSSLAVGMSRDEVVSR